MRTDAEKQAFAMKCMEIEKAGGDVLGYVEVNWPSYSPRATWYNLQRQYLNRNTNKLTEGKRKEGNELRRDRKAMLDGVLHVLSEKGDPIAWLKEQGYANPNQAWTDLRAWANKHGLNQGRLPGNLSKYYAMLRRQESDEEPAAVDLDQHPEQVKEAVTRVFFGGKEYEKMDSPSPTCCQPARPSGVEVPDELPPVDRFVVEDKAGNKCTYTDEVDAWDPDTLQKYKVYPVGSHERIAFKPTRVQSLLGTWQNNVKDQTFTFAPNEPNGGFISMPITDWLNLAAEIPEAIKALSK